MAWVLPGILQGFTLGCPEILLALACSLFLFWQLNHRIIPVNWPVVGMLPTALAQLYRLHDWATAVLRESGCTFEFKGPWLSGMDLVATCDPANVNHIFNAHFSNYPKGDDFLEIFDILGNGIFNADHESWKMQRKTAHLLITDQRFRCFVAETSRIKVEKGLIPFLEHAEQRGEVFDLQDIFLRFTFDTTSTLVFGIDPGCLSVGLPTVPFAKAMDDAEEAILYRHVVPKSWWKVLRWLGIGEEKKLAMAWETIDHFITKHIWKRIEERSKASKDQSSRVVEEEAAADLLTSYLDHLADEGDQVENTAPLNEFLRDTTLNFMLAGRDTTGAGLSWFFWLVSKHPDVESKILEELKAYAPEIEKNQLLIMFDNNDLSKLVYLHASLCESLRLYPPVPFEHKGVLQPDVLPSGHRVDRKTKIFFSLYSMGRVKGVWGEDCMEFKPERWISESGKIKHEPSYKFLSFNSGPRTCLGKDMAFTQMKAVAATMIYNFQVQVLENHVVAPKFSIILHMKNGLMVRVKKRKSA